MWRNHLRMAARTLRNERLYAGINILGLAVGLACCLLLGLYVRDELTYDRFHSQADRLFRVTMDAAVRDETWGTTSPPLASAIEAEVPGVAATIRWWNSRHVIRCAEQSRTETLHFADPPFFEAFSFPLRQGNPATALSGPRQIVLSERMAQRCFGSTDAVGNTVQVMLDTTFVPHAVSGVAANPPHSSSIQFSAVLPFAQVETVRGTNYVESWGNLSTTTFVLLRKSASARDAEAAIADVANANYSTDLIDFTTEGGDRIPHRLQPLTAMHLDPSVGSGRGLQSPNTPMYAALLGGLALLVLVVACINFANLSIGRSLRRVEEIGVRKALGAQRTQLALQFVTEAVLASAIAVVLGMGIATLTLPVFNTLVGKTLVLTMGDAGFLGVMAIGLTGLTGLLAGNYPALVLSRLRPAESLRSHERLGVAGGWAKGLVVAQFALSAFLMAGALGIQAQLAYIQDKELGYDPAALVRVDLYGDGAQTVDRLREAVRGEPSVRTVAAAADGLSRTPVEVGSASFDTYHHWVSDDYRSALGLTLSSGRFLNVEQGGEGGQAVVVNEAFVEEAGLQAPLGTTLSLFDGEWQPTVVGVVEDFHFQSLHVPVQPMILHQASHDGPEQAWVRVEPAQVGAALAALEAAWQRVAPMQPFDYRFEQDAIEQQYRDDRRWQQVVGWAAGFVLGVAALGLFGLATLAVAQRTKEIGIRKALGATVTSIIGLLSKDFARLIGVAVCVGLPAAYVAMQWWLQDFAYRTTLGPGLFLGAAGLALTAALLAVSTQAWRAARLDPTTALRKE